MSEDSGKGLFSHRGRCDPGAPPLMSAGVMDAPAGKRLFTKAVDALLSLPTISFLETGLGSYRVCLCLCLFQKGILLEWATNVVHLIMLSVFPSILKQYSWLAFGIYSSFAMPCHLNFKKKKKEKTKQAKQLFNS